MISTHIYDSHHLPSDDENSEEVCNAIRDLRNLRITKAKDEVSQPSVAESAFN